MRLSTPLVIAAMALLIADDVLGQRRRRGSGRRRPTEAAPPAPTPEATEKKKVEHWLAVTGGDVYLGTGQLVRRATVLIGDDKIHAVGHDLDIPEGATEIDATGKVVSPGFVAVKAQGMGAPRTNTGKVVDSLNPYDPNIKMGLAAGVTSWLATFDQGSDKPGGKSAVLKLAFGDLEGMVLAENTVYSMRVPLTPGQLEKLRDNVEKAKEHLEKERKAREGGAATTPPAAAKPASGNASGSGASERGSRSRPRPGTKASSKDGAPKGTEEILKIMRGEAVLWVSCQREYNNRAIHQALEVAALLGEGVVLDNPITAWSLPDEIAETGSMAIINPRARNQPDPTHPDTTGSNIASAAILSRAGVPIAVTPPGGRFGGSGLGTGGILGQDLHTLHLDAAYAVRGGLDNRKALRAITLDAARMIGASDRVGSLEVGKDADLLILDGDPLHYRTFVETAVVNGKVVYEKDKEPFYRHIKR